MFLRWTRTVRFSGVVGLALTCGLLASLPSSQTNSQASFAAPPLLSVAGSEVGLTGFFSMAKGDFNGDGIPDFAVAGFACSNGPGLPADSVAVYLGNGDGTLKAPVYYAAGRCPYQVVVGHVRAQGTPEDLVVVDAGVGNNVTVLLGNGDGTFQTPITAASFVGSITAAAIGDFNGDGKPDIAVSAWGGSGATGGNLQTLAILLGNGNGTFAPPVFYQSVINPYGIAVGDFNKDGKLDVILQNPEALAVSLGNGDGTFLPGYVVLTEPTTLVSVTPPGPILNGLLSFALGDFNEDGNLDIAAQEDGERIDILLGTGTGTFSPPVTYLNNQHQSGHGGGQIAAARLKNGGHVDLVVSTGYGTTLGIFRGNGDGTFQSPQLYPLPQYNDAGLLVADLNNDGPPDIVTGTMGGRGLSPNFLTVLLNNGNGDFGTPPPLFSIIAPYNRVTTTNAIGIALADLTGNGKLDAITTNWGIPIEPLTNGQFPMPPTIDPNNQTIDTHGSISVLAGNGDGTFQAEQQYFVGGRPIATQTADLTGDGKIDIVVVNAFDNQLSILKGNGNRTYQPAISIPVGKNPTSLALADVNGDGKPDIVVTNLVDNNISVLINQSTPGNISFKAPVTYAVGTYPAGIVARDFNHDGKIDIAVVNSGNFFGASKDTTLSTLTGNGDGTFQPAVTQILWGGYNGSGGDAIAAADFGTGQIDLVVANFAFNEVMNVRGHGDGTFTPAGTYKVGSGPEAIVAVDFDRDGKIDIAVNNLNDNTVTLLRGNGDGTFVPAADRSDDTTRPFGFATWGYPAFMAAGDLNGDGKPEIVTTHLFESAITVLRNTTIPPVQLINIVSRKIHGGAGTFDVDLTIGSAIECRSGGSNGDYTLVFKFAAPLASVGSASVASGTGTVRSSAIGNDTHQYIVNLTGVINAQTLTVNLSNVADASGNFSSAVSGSMRLLVGDTTGNGLVNSSDIAQTQSQSGQAVTASNFREDVTVNGVINSSDIALVQSKSGTAMPTSAPVTAPLQPSSQVSSPRHSKTSGDSRRPR